MSPSLEILVNVLDTTAFALAGAEIFGKEKLKQAFEGIITYFSNLEIGYRNNTKFFKLVLLYSGIYIFSSLVSSAFYFLSGYQFLFDFVSYFGIIVPFFFVLLLIIMVSAGVFYKQLLEKYESSRALLILGGFMFLLSRAISINAAIEDAFPNFNSFYQKISYKTTEESPTINLGLDRDKNFGLFSSVPAFVDPNQFVSAP